MSPLLSLGQIPIKRISKNILVFDKIFDSIATANHYSKYINKNYNFSDVDKDGKLDMVLQAYSDKSASATLNIFYNKSSETQYLFQNKYNYFYRGHNLTIDVGDVNKDGKPDILAPTENYHGLPENKPLAYYPNNTDHSPDKLFVQNEIGFTEFTQPDTLNTITGKLIDTDGDGTPEWISSNYSKPNNGYLMWHYTFKNNAIQRTFILQSESNQNGDLYLGALDKLEDEKYLYFPFKAYHRPIANSKQDIPKVIYVLRYKKGQANYKLGVACDTIATIPYEIKNHMGLNYFYEVCNEDGIKLVDLNNDGFSEVIVMRYINYLSGEKRWALGDPPVSIFKIYDKVGNDLTDKYIEKEMQSDPQNYFSTNGFAYTDINGDGLKDILPNNNWGWATWGKIDQVDRQKKYIFLQTGKGFKGFFLNIAGQTNIQSLEGFSVPINLRAGNSQSIIILNPSNEQFTSTGNSNIVDLDFSQFKFPCETNMPNIGLLENINFCSASDSLVLNSGAETGTGVKWYSGNTLVSSNPNLSVKNSGIYKVVLNNLGGCTNEKTIKINKVTNPAAPTITREGNTTLISSVPTGNQWYLNGNIIKGEVGQKINATVNGLYSVKYTDANGCLSENSASLYGLITATGLTDKKVIISPNPFDQSIKIEFPEDFGPFVHAKIHDVKGVVVWEKESVRDSEMVDLSSLSVGNYVLNLTSQTNGQVSVVKISKQGR